MNHAGEIRRLVFRSPIQTAEGPVSLIVRRRAKSCPCSRSRPGCASPGPRWRCRAHPAFHTIADMFPVASSLGDPTRQRRRQLGVDQKPHDATCSTVWSLPSGILQRGGDIAGFQRRTVFQYLHSAELPNRTAPDWRAICPDRLRCDARERRAPPPPRLGREPIHPIPHAIPLC
jgi:hypothetical protein